MLGDILLKIGAVAFMVFFFGFCIFIHELGHFLAAKWRGLHVIAFSIGFFVPFSALTRTSSSFSRYFTDAFFCASLTDIPHASQKIQFSICIIARYFICVHIILHKHMDTYLFLLPFLILCAENP